MKLKRCKECRFRAVISEEKVDAYDEIYLECKDVGLRSSTLEEAELELDGLKYTLKPKQRIKCVIRETFYLID